MPVNYPEILGLTTEQVNESRQQFGDNNLKFKKENWFINAVKSLAKEPMVLLLLVASVIYFISGKTGDGIFLSSAIVLVAAISLYQDSRSRNALEKLKSFTQAKCRVIRNNIEEEINTEELVIGDNLIIEEGNSIPADGRIIRSNDFSINESILTGESLPVFKDSGKEDNLVYRGTTVASGLAIIELTAIGNETKLGKIGKSLESITEEKTPLEKQIGNFVKKMVIAGLIIFLIVWLINYFRSYDILDSLIKALTLAMSILPEEIPVAFTTFMALGAWRLMKMGIIVKQMKTVETLGSANILCIDKTGTITENKMSIAKLYGYKTQRIIDPDSNLGTDEKELIRLSMFASEPIPFDPMEIALHKLYSETLDEDERVNFKIFHEYPLSGKPPMMTHLFKDSSGNKIIAAKGAPEAMLEVSELSFEDKETINIALNKLTKEGYRVLGVGEAVYPDSNYPLTQQEFKFNFKGLIAFYDPPKGNISNVLKGFYDAGITIKIITGDNPETTSSIAKEIGFLNYDKAITGDNLMKLSDKEFQQNADNIFVFTRMFPEAKLRIINALKDRNYIVAMTGDGVNDGPALKAAHIGIAMGKKGTEIAKQAASIILQEDDLSKMLDAIAMGRKIYSNLKKAIQYIISIHIPIILTVFLPLAFGWIYPNIFSPVHIIFLELIMGPTCSIIYENEPIEQNMMIQKPRLYTKTFFSWKELATSVLQGLIITAGTLSCYYYAVNQGYNETLTRTMVFTVLISANIFLTLVNRSFYYSILTTLKYKNNLVLYIILITIAITGMLLYIEPLTNFFEFEKLNGQQLGISIAIGFASVIWFEVVKMFKVKVG